MKLPYGFATGEQLLAYFRRLLASAEVNVTLLREHVAEVERQIEKEKNDEPGRTDT